MTVKLSGKEYGVTFSMAVQIEYEEMSGKPFDFETLETQKDTMQLCYASLKEANGKLPFTFGELVKKLTVGETAELKNAVLSAMQKWYELPEVMKKDEQPADGEEPKNA